MSVFRYFISSVQGFDKFGKYYALVTLKNFSSQAEKEKTSNDELYSIADDVEYNAEEIEQQIEIKRNKSRLLPQHLNMLKGIPPYSEEKADYHNTIKYKRAMFGRYGKISQVDPSTLWPNQSDIEEIIEYEKVAYPYTFQEMVTKVNKRKLEEIKAIQDRQRKLVENAEKLNKWIKDVEARKEKKLKDLAAAKAKRDALLEEVRRQFGYKIDSRDEKFQQAVLQKEKDQKKRLKEEKAKAKQERLLAELSQQK